MLVHEALRHALHSMPPVLRISPFFFHDTSTTEIYTLSLHDALPISPRARRRWTIPPADPPAWPIAAPRLPRPRWRDRKSTRLNSSHVKISYAVFCLKKNRRYWTKTHRQICKPPSTNVLLSFSAHSNY